MTDDTLHSQAVEAIADRQARERMIPELHLAGFSRGEIRTALMVPRDVVDRALDGVEDRDPASHEDKRLNLTSQMYRLNTECWKQVKACIAEGDRDLARKYMIEIRRQFETLAKIEAQVFAIKDVRLFQQVVLRSVQSVDPELRVKIEKEFAKRRSMALIGQR